MATHVTTAGRVPGVVAESSIETSAYSKVTWRLLPFLFACYVFAYLDRVNVGFAKLQMLNDFVNSVGNISGFVAPSMVGWIKDRSGSASPALLVIAACMTLASLLVFRVPKQLVNK